MKAKEELESFAFKSSILMKIGNLAPTLFHVSAQINKYFDEN